METNVVQRVEEGNKYMHYKDHHSVIMNGGY